MKIIRNIEVPTGNILVVDGEKGQLECLSLGDYGKDTNIVADFLGLDMLSLFGIIAVYFTIQLMIITALKD
jgi:hypothetical protein